MDCLEIIIPTYNRKEHLTRTLTQLTAQESPVRDLSITVLDNASTDGSAEVIAQFVARYKNIKHIRHPRNIGGNANITRAFEIACAPYVWVVCDDDSFRWESWGEIQTALESNIYDCLLTRKNDLKGSSDIARIFRQCTFLPAGIYRTALITDGVLFNMYNNIPNMFPHLALISEIFNRKGSIFLPQGEIMDQCTFDASTGDGWYARGAKGAYLPQPTTHMFWTVGFVASLHLIQDKKLRAYILDHVGKHGFFGYIWAAFRANYTFYDGYKLNEKIVASVLNRRQRVEFWLACQGRKFLSLFLRKKSALNDRTE
ncbi:MAG: glycosyltransferase [Elusimicrobiaceae bacterium]|nr:glycosyltransferase [Elusimicrobiaceae bacterium]